MVFHLFFQWWVVEMRFYSKQLEDAQDNDENQIFDYNSRRNEAETYIAIQFLFAKIGDIYRYIRVFLNIELQKIFLI